MKIFRHRENGELYNIYHVTPWRILGKWYEAVPFFPSRGKLIKHADLQDFDTVCDDNSRSHSETHVSHDSQGAPQLLRQLADCVDATPGADRIRKSRLMKQIRSYLTNHDNR